MRDSYNREINYLRISVTDNCNLRCQYCMPDESFPVIDEDNFISFSQILSVVKAAVELGIYKFRLTGGEPTVRKGIVDLVRGIKQIEGVQHLAMTTNGVFFDKLGAPLKEAGLDSVNISLDTLDPIRYKILTRGGDINKVLAGIDAAAQSGYPFKINMVILDENSHKELPAMRTFASSKGGEIQTIQFYHLDQQKEDGHIFNRPQHCSLCNRIRLLADGRILTCLHSDSIVPIDFTDIKSSLIRAINIKPEHGTKSSLNNVNYMGG